MCFYSVNLHTEIDGHSSSSPSCSNIWDSSSLHFLHWSDRKIYIYLYIYINRFSEWKCKFLKEAGHFDALHSDSWKCDTKIWVCVTAWAWPKAESCVSAGCSLTDGCWLVQSRSDFSLEAGAWQSKFTWCLNSLKANPAPRPPKCLSCYRSLSWML